MFASVDGLNAVLLRLVGRSSVASLQLPQTWAFSRFRYVTRRTSGSNYFATRMWYPATFAAYSEGSRSRVGRAGRKEVQETTGFDPKRGAGAEQLNAAQLLPKCRHEHAGACLAGNG